MELEGQSLDRKSLRSVTGKSPRWNDLVTDCVALANAQGGRLLIGIEDDDSEPASDQCVPDDLVEKVRRRIGELTVNVAVFVEIACSKTTGGEYLVITVARSSAPASTTDGRYYLRVSDESRPLVGEDVQRLLNERSAQPWETLTTLGISHENADRQGYSVFCDRIRASDRVKDSVREKTDKELLDHYCLSIDDCLTNLGILCIGRQQDRARLGTAPIIQFIKYDDDGNKVNKLSWDDHTLSPMDLIEAVWKDVPDFRERFELPDGLFRQQVPVYDEKVVRELLVNALVRRPYTQSGDIYLNLHPDRLEIVNPGLLPLGVTPQNILHQSVRRNHELARIFHDLKLMEREGSGYDLVYDVLLSHGQTIPEVRQGPDRVEVTIRRRIVKPEIIDLIARADQAFDLTQRERITLGLLAQHDGLTARQIADQLNLKNTTATGPWLGRLVELSIVNRAGRSAEARIREPDDLVANRTPPAGGLDSGRPETPSGFVTG